jgi:radical SAM superfamily enzyme YgiQ (UPF0313 family)
MEGRRAFFRNSLRFARRIWLDNRFDFHLQRHGIRIVPQVAGLSGRFSKRRNKVLLYLINPSNPMVSVANAKKTSSKKYLVWKPLGLLIIASLTPPEWEVVIIDENIEVPDYDALPRPDLVGITAFTSQANRAYKIGDMFRKLGVPTIMGGIHASMRTEEAARRFDSMVSGEAEGVWKNVLDDAKAGALKPRYHGHYIDMENMPVVKHEMLATGYQFGSIQTTRGCPLSCEFCSVSEFSGKIYRQRPIEHVIDELKRIREKYILIVDDNLIGTSKKHMQRAKDLFRAIIDAKVNKKFVAQVTVNMADDDELLTLARKAGCTGVFIGFESPQKSGLLELKKLFNLQNNRNFRKSVKKIQSYGMLVAGSFIIGLDVDEKGIGFQIARAALHYGVDFLNLLFLTPLPGTRLWKKMELEDRIAANNFPEDWNYYTLTLPTMNYRNLSWNEMFKEVTSCLLLFYSRFHIFLRLLRSLIVNRKFANSFLSIAGNIFYRQSLFWDLKIFSNIDTTKGISHMETGTFANIQE